MTEGFAAELLDANAARMIADGVHFPDYARLRQSIAHWEGWFEAWAQMAHEYEVRAEEALARGSSVTAGEMWFQASIMWQYAQFLWFDYPDQRAEGQRRKVASYRRGAPNFRPPAERIQITFEDTVIPAYLRLPDGVARAPCVVLIGGLESTKEESYHFEAMCLRRGIATCAFDGPGQGEYFVARPMVDDFERYTSAVVDYLIGRREVDCDRLAVLGRSLGGYYAVRSGASDERFRAIVAFGAMCDLCYFEDMAPLTQRGFRYVTGIRDPDEAERAARSMIDLRGAVESLDRPLYVLHGARDELIPVSQAHLLDHLTPLAPKKMVIEPDGNHCAHNLYHLVRPAMADWLARQLDL